MSVIGTKRTSGHPLTALDRTATIACVANSIFVLHITVVFKIDHGAGKRRAGMAGLAQSVPRVKNDPISEANKPITATTVVQSILKKERINHV